MKAVLISIKPKWIELIINGQKTIEVRKARPKLKTPFKCYIYMTQGTYKDLGTYSDWIYENRMRVIGEFVCDRIDEFSVFENGAVQYWNYHDLEKSCLTYDEISNYISKNKKGYAWHISGLKIYDEPKELSEFKYHCKYELDDDFKHCYGCDYHYYSNIPSSGIEEYCTCDGLKTLTRPPQSWCYVEEK